MINPAPPHPPHELLARWPELAPRTRWTRTDWHGTERWVGKRSAGLPVVLCIRRRPVARWIDLSGDLSAMVAAAQAAVPPNEGSIVFLALVVPGIGAPMVESCRALMHELHPLAHWALVAPDGKLLADAQTRSVRRAPRRRVMSGDGPRDMFSDANARLLKTLILSRTPQAFWPNVEMRLAGDANSGLALAQRAGVGRETAYRFLRVFGERGYLPQDGSLRILRLDTLLREWFAAESARPPRFVYARSHLFGPIDSRERVLALLGDVGEQARSLVVGGGAATAFANLEHATWNAPLFHVCDRSVPALVDELGLQLFDRANAQLRLRQGPEQGSVDRASTMLPAQSNGVQPWIVDPIQMALDVLTTEPRGPEAAAFLLERIVAEHDRG